MQNGQGLGKKEAFPREHQRFSYRLLGGLSSFNGIEKPLHLMCKGFEKQGHKRQSMAS
jgi:hypothetical protein